MAIRKELIDELIATSGGSLWWTPLSRPKSAFNKLMLGESELG